MKTKEILIWIGIIVILVGGLWLLILGVNNSPSQTTVTEIKGVPAISDKDYIRGEKSAKVTLIEYGDFQCPACGAYYPIVKQVEADFPKDLRVVYRYMPLKNVHQNAMIAAQAAYAAGKKDKFWEMHDKLYENQNNWAGEQSPRDIFIGYAKDLGLDVDQFTKDMDSSEAKDYIDNQEQVGFSIGIQSTPTFFINGKNIPNVNGYEGLKTYIQDEINKK